MQLFYPGRCAHFVFRFSNSSTCQCSTQKISRYRVSGRARSRNIPRARSKHTSSTVETFLEHSRSTLRARSKPILSSRETYFEYVRNKLPAISKNTDCSAVVQSQKKCFFFSINELFDSNCKPVIQKIEKLAHK